MMPPVAGKTRSPNYPSVGLGGAIESARRFYSKAQRATLHPEEAVKAMGYEVASGAARTRLSALRKYGLLTDAPNGVRLSDDAISILVLPEADPERQAIINRLALLPDLFAELAQEFRNTEPSLVAAHLQRAKRFSQAGAKQAADAFRDTMALVRDSGAGYSALERESSETRPLMTLSDRVMGPPPESFVPVRIPLAANVWATLQAPFPLTEAAWTQMLAVLQAMKPGLVAKPVDLSGGDVSKATDPEDALRRATPSAEPEARQSRRQSDE